MREFVIGSFGELLELSQELSANGDFCFRGQANADWSLVPAMFRGLQLSPELSDAEKTQFASIERDIYREFGERAIRHVREQHKWLLLCHAQHYGTPTRLLDWTTNRLVGIYFAVSESLETAGALWCLDMAQLDTQLPVSVGRRARGRGLRNEVMPNNDLSFFEPLSKPISQQAKALPENFLAVFQPPDIDERIVNQRGLFTVHVTFGADDRADGFEASHEDLLNTIEARSGRELVCKIILPAEHKVAIKEEIETMGLDPSYLFPDLLGLGQYLTGKRLELLQTDLIDARNADAAVNRDTA